MLGPSTNKAIRESAAKSGLPGSRSSCYRWPRRMGLPPLRNRIYNPPGGVYEWRAGSLFAVGFDLGRLQVTGSPAPMLEGAMGLAGGADAAAGGKWPRWARSGRELFYRSGGRLLAVEIEAGPGFRGGTPKVLFEALAAERPGARGVGVVRGD